MEGVFNGEVLYDRLDTSGGDVRLRLRSTVVRVEHIDGGSRVAVHYATPDGEIRRVTGKGVIVNAWGTVAKHIVPELSEEAPRNLSADRRVLSTFLQRVRSPRPRRSQ